MYILLCESILQPCYQCSGADLAGGCRGMCTPAPPRDDLRFSNTTGILPKNYMWFIGVEVEQD